MLNKNVYRVGIVVVVAISVFCGYLYYMGGKENRLSLNAEGAYHEYQEFVADSLRKIVESMQVVSSCDVDFRMENSAFSEVILNLECVDPIGHEMEEKIKNTVARAIDLPAENISIRY